MADMKLENNADMTFPGLGCHTIIVPGPPISKKSPRFARRGKYVATINDQVTEEGKFFLQAREQWIGLPLEGPVRLTMFFFFPRPKYHFGTGRNAKKLKPGAPKNHFVKPDSSNLLKFAEDCLKGLVWKDDCQVCDVLIRKDYITEDDEPRTVIFIRDVE